MSCNVSNFISKREVFSSYFCGNFNSTIMIYISRDAHFCAAHKLYNEKWSKEKNEEIFGACANENWHGHNFDMTVTVKGSVDPETGFVMNFKDLKIVHSLIIFF